jgi:SAM-dependent methyltransferase
MTTQDYKRRLSPIVRRPLPHGQENWLPGIEPEIVNPSRTRMNGGSCNAARDALYERYAGRLIVNPELTRSLVSFQSNKGTAFYRWFKYKEAFSHEFALYVLGGFRKSGRRRNHVLDPFAGAGTTLTSAAGAGWRATGIELLPVGIAAMRARLLADSVEIAAFDLELARLKSVCLSQRACEGYRFPHLRITQHAFSEAGEAELSGFMSFIESVADEKVRYLFWFAALSILEDVSYTRKDGQYLRWDVRSGRELRSTFNKGPIPRFRAALLSKLAVMRADLNYRNEGSLAENVKVIEGSCLDVLPALPEDSFDLVLTSPPYCNRYDYTRTYALELAFLNYGEDAVSKLRQALLSATVENRTKRQLLAEAYSRRGQSGRYEEAVAAFDRQTALHEVLRLLQTARDRNQLNNPNIPTMVENYFFEMNLVIRQLSRVLRPGGHVVMVNDNVQYQAEEVPVDLILSDFAEMANLSVEAIWVLPRGKGNSSQQMGLHGRNELRKCVYIWSK